MDKNGIREHENCLLSDTRSLRRFSLQFEPVAVVAWGSASERTHIRLDFTLSVCGKSVYIHMNYHTHCIFITDSILAV